MQYYGQYKGVRNGTWELLIQSSLGRLPVPVFQLTGQLGIPVIDYAAAQTYLQTLHLAGHCHDNDGFALCSGDFWCVFLGDQASHWQSRLFTLAHELGHVFLGHRMQTQTRLDTPPIHYTKINNPSLNTGIERAANLFATRLLSPACVLWALSLRMPTHIVGHCGIPLYWAQKRAERMELLYQRDQFLQTQRERDLFSLFTEYILSQSPHGCFPDHVKRRLEQTNAFMDPV